MMKKKLRNFCAILLSIACYTHLQAQNVLYVDSANVSGTHDGTSWATAYDSLQVAINASSSGDSIFVAKGTYQPASDTSYIMKEGVQLYGGFAGTESSLAQRDLSAGHTSILKGNGNRVIDNSSNKLTAAAALDGFVVTGGTTSTYGSGAGMYNYSSSPTLTNVTFSNNSASNGGGGMYNYSSSPTLVNVIFSNNSTNSTNGNGGGMTNIYSSPTLANVTFSNNSANSNGGGMFNLSSSSTLANVIFSNNSAGSGGGMSNQSSSPTLTNVTFNNNLANYAGGGLINVSSSSPVIRNTVFWGNTAGPGGFWISDIYNSSSTPIVIYCYTQTAISGTGNIQDSANPFVNAANPAGADGIWMTADDGLALVCGSSAINAGSNADIPSGDTTDITGAPRIQQTTVDMGAYENSRVSSSSSQTITAAGSYTSPSGKVWTSSGAYKDTIPNAGGCDSIMTFNLAIVSRIYVDSANVSGTHDGKSWETAYDRLQVAIHASSSGDSIFVAKGTYQPVSDSSFSMKEGVQLYGGFAGTESSLAQRDLSASHTSILKGNGNRVIDNSSKKLTAAAVLDGFVVTGGTTSTYGSGAGMYNYSSSPTLTNIIFSNNSAGNRGGGMYNYSSSPTLTNVTFSKNSVGGYGFGGGMFNVLSSPTLTNVTLSNNFAPYGGGICNEASSSVIHNTVFWDNTASGGADIYDTGSSVTTVIYCYTQTAISGTGNIQGSTDPFVNAANPAGADGIWMTADDGLALVCGSSAINAGSNADIPSGDTTDITGAPRIQQTIVDMGAYENSGADTAVTPNGVSLTATATGATFQWLNCDKGFAAISGATSATYTAPTNGSYAVQVTQNTCVDTSTCYTTTITGMSMQENNTGLSIYPNPTTGNFTLDLGSEYQSVDIRLTDITGKVMLEKTVTQTGLITMESEAPKGVYFLHLNPKDGNATTIKLVKE